MWFVIVAFPGHTGLSFLSVCFSLAGKGKAQVFYLSAITK